MSRLMTSVVLVAGLACARPAVAEDLSVRLSSWHLGVGSDMPAMTWEARALAPVGGEALRAKDLRRLHPGSRPRREMVLSVKVPAGGTTTPIWPEQDHATSLSRVATATGESLVMALRFNGVDLPPIELPVVLGPAGATAWLEVSDAERQLHVVQVHAYVDAASEGEGSSGR